MIRLLSHISAIVRYSSATRASAWRSGEAVPAPRSLSLFFNFLQNERSVDRRGHSRTTGFSLVEVMLAVVVLGLGILGLSAIFAGGARQQQISSNIIESVAIGLNAKAILKRKLGALEGVNPTNVIDGRWAWINSISAANISTTALDVSTIDPSGTAFFRVTAPLVVLYNIPPDIMGAPPNGAVGQGTFFNGSPAPPFGNGAVSGFPHSRIIPSSLTIRVSVAQQGGVFGEDETFLFSMRAPIPPDVPELSQSFTLRRVDDLNNTSDFITVDPGQTGTNSFIQSFALNGLVSTGTRWISKIEALPYDWRSTELVSINERLTYVEDGRFPPAGQRPKLGYVLFFRRFGELNQAMILIYSLTPQSRPTLTPDQFPFTPPDDQVSATDMVSPQTNSLVRLLNAEVYWDDIRKQYYLRVPNDEDNRWLTAPGQILLMRNPTTNPNGQGSDDVIRVISQVEDEDDSSFVRGYLDDAPRVKLQAVTRQVPDLPTQIQVFALQREVVNADPSDKTRWTVRPVDARLVPIVAQ
jgi:Prokaryotic N-terminal methylation motif